MPEEEEGGVRGCAMKGKGQDFRSAPRRTRTYICCAAKRPKGRRTHPKSAWRVRRKNGERAANKRGNRLRAGLLQVAKGKNKRSEKGTQERGVDGGGRSAGEKRRENAKLYLAGRLTDQGSAVDVERK